MTSLLLDLEEIEKDISVLLKLDGSRSEECVALTTILISKIRTNLLTVFNSMSDLYKSCEAYDTNLPESSIKGKDLVSTLCANLFLKCLFKIVLMNNNTAEVLTPILEQFSNEHNGINTSIKNILNVIK